MSSEELRTIIGEIVSLLKKNKEFANKEFLDIIGNVIVQVKTNDTYKKMLSVLLNVDENGVSNLITAAERFREMEIELTDDTTDKVVGLLEKLKSHNLILSLIAKII